MKRVFRDNIRTLIFGMSPSERILSLDEMSPSPMRDALVEMNRRFVVVEDHFRQTGARGTPLCRMSDQSDESNATTELLGFTSMMQRLMGRKT